MTDKSELARRKLFIKAAHDVIKVWPGYAAHQLPAPTNRTDQCIQCDLRFSLQRLVETWQDCRADRATDAEFSDALGRWASGRIHAAEVFGIGKPEGDHAVDKKTKFAIEVARRKSGFRKAEKL